MSGESRMVLHRAEEVSQGPHGDLGADILGKLHRVVMAIGLKPPLTATPESLWRALRNEIDITTPETCLNVLRSGALPFLLDSMIRLDALPDIQYSTTSQRFCVSRDESVVRFKICADSP